MKVLYHHIYEYKKGLRNLVLHTVGSSEIEEAEERLKKHNIDYIVHRVSENRYNIFFGSGVCVNVIKSFGNKKLDEFTLEEDFILGTMLGYDRVVQCKRYLELKQKKNNRIKASA